MSVKLRVRSSTSTSNSDKSDKSDESTEVSDTAPMDASKYKVSSSNYKHYSQREHVYKIPDTYIGSIEKTERQEWILQPQKPATFGEEGKIVENGEYTKNFRLYAEHQNITVPGGLERLFVEGISNAGDNVPRSRRAGVDPDVIEVRMDRQSIVIKSGGLPIPIDLTTVKEEREGTKEVIETTMYVPEMTFGLLLSGSNYEGTREGAGRNGFGAKLINIFSKQFTVAIGDPANGKSFKKIWRNNMLECDAPEIRDDYRGKPYVIISWKLDFERFGYTEYPDEAFGLFARICADIAYNWKVPVIFNGQRFSFSKSEEFASIYYHEGVEAGLTLYLWAKGTVTVKKGKTFLAEDPTVRPLAEIFMIDTKDNSMMSFVNGMMTRDGGVHVNSFMKVMSKAILDTLKASAVGGGVNKDKDKKGKAKKVANAPRAERFPLTINDVKGVVSFIACFYLDDPKFTSQSKTCLAAPEPYVHVEPEALNPIYKWSIMNKLYMLLEMKNEGKLSKTDGKRGRYNGPSKIDEANEAGGKLAHECSLFIFEGNSAQGYGKAARQFIPNGNDYIGLLPLRGKILNVTGMDKGVKNIEKIQRNKEISLLKKALGLEENKDYSLEANFNRLRYGRIILATDADVDGCHIKGLVINYFMQRFPSLFNAPKQFVFELRLPIVRLYHGKTITIPFYTTRQYKEYIEVHPECKGKGWHAQYFKGLGTSTEADVKEDFKDPKYIYIEMDTKAPEAIKLAFDKKFSDIRKDWIAKYDGYELGADIKIKPITSFVNFDLINFSIYDIVRSIPRFSDGLKPSQRKALWGCFLKWPNFQNSTIGEDKKIKVSNFVGAIIEGTQYHHGDTSMAGTIIGMAQDFVGANNLGYFTKDGNYGFRDLGGKDAASPRYIFTRPNWWLGYIFRKEDNVLLVKQVDEGQEIEPDTFYPIIPMSVVNGANGIGTGWSTFIPNHNPLDVITWLKAKIRGKPTYQLYPWYKGFRGTIEILDRNAKQKVVITPNYLVKQEEVSSDTSDVEDSEDVDDIAPVNADKQEDNDEDAEEDNIYVAETPSINVAKERISMVTRGKYAFKGNKVHIQELPIGRWTTNYKNWLEECASNKLIKGFRDIGKTPETPEFLIDGFQEYNDKDLKLVKAYGLTNMVLLDERNVPMRFSNVIEILELFYQKRLPIYEKRREIMLEDIRRTVERFSLKRKLVYLVAVEKVFSVLNRPDEEIDANLDKHGISREILKSIPGTGWSEQAVKRLDAEMAKLEAQYQELLNMSALDIWWNELDELEKVLVKDFGKKLYIRKNAAKGNDSE